jgi:hypothetical protein
VSVAEEDDWLRRIGRHRDLSPQARFAGCILFVKATGSHSEAGVMPRESGHPGFHGT